MSLKDTDRKGPRIVCTRMHESDACDNRRRYYLADVERRVIAVNTVGLKSMSAANTGK